ncbi:hypothetical protein HMPREF0290_2032 [Corynebacterium efficiens YS-314]|uniref:Uncharacterized protein n=2 Tax=Corynebacterium efficiens TaxID=152794 RepID=Q8FNZ3_COREF|nr:hypothetical protein HMPREF0290_2032 [Corynebacterium efficiens YS-314]BAC18810.1 hypothetical protein [Corynebacterium efficiens YS-314]
MSLMDFSDTVLASTTTQPDAGNRWMIYGLFIIAGLFIGGAWSAYKAENKIGMFVAGAIGIIAAVAGILWTIGEMT